MIAVSGDGFYMFGTPAPALWSAAHHGAPFLQIVYTNRSYTTGTERIVNNYGADSYAARDGFRGGWFDPPIDFAKEAEAAGAHGETVRDPAELEAAPGPRPGAGAERQTGPSLDLAQAVARRGLTGATGN